MSKKRNQKYLNAFGKNLQRLRKEKNFSQENLALEADLDYMQIFRIEHGKVNTSISMLLVIAQALGIEPKDLLDFEFFEKDSL